MACTTNHMSNLSVEHASQEGNLLPNIFNYKQPPAFPLDDVVSIELLVCSMPDHHTVLWMLMITPRCIKDASMRVTAASNL